MNLLRGLKSFESSVYKIMQLSGSQRWKRCLNKLFYLSLLTRERMFVHGFYRKLVEETFFSRCQVGNDGASNEGGCNEQ